jgi:hypothetical protein
MTEPTPSPLMEFILTLLTPFLMTGGITDIHLARLAANEAIAAYTGETPTQLITIGQILAFALTALDNLRLSLPPDLSLSMKLKLRGNANALNRSARDQTQRLDRAKIAAAPPHPSIAEQAAMAAWDDIETGIETEAEIGPQPSTNPPEPAPNAHPPENHPPENHQPAAATSAPAPTTPATAKQQNSLHWANAMRTAATRLRAKTPHVPPAQQKTNMLWVDVLTGVASDLTRGQPPAATKTASMRTTLMASGATFPAHIVSPAKP